MLEAKVEAFLSHHSFSLEDKNIVVGVSGGPDSLALLHYLLRQKEKQNITIVAAHVDHMFRGEESFEDAMFVKSFCEENEIPFEMARVNIPEMMERTGKSSQVAAREARYDFFGEVMEKYGFKLLALAHHGDDQIETMLMRFTRGSSGKARAGIPFLRPFYKGCIFRPFLSMTKKEIEEYCRINGLEPRLDPSNLKEVYSRNRFRKHVLPFLKSENRQVHEQFQRLSEDLQTDENYLQELTAEKMNRVIIKRVNSQVSIDTNVFRDMPMPLQRRGIQLILEYLYKKRPESLSAIHIDQIYSLIYSSHPSGKLDLPGGLKVVRSYSDCHFQFDLQSHDKYRLELAEPGSVYLPDGSGIKLEIVDHLSPFLTECGAFFNIKNLEWPIVIRNREKGDKMSLKGMSGSKKVKDIFINSKVPISLRKIWPLITDGKGEILWIPGLKKSALEGISQAAEHYVLLTFKSNYLLGGTWNDER